MVIFYLHKKWLQLNANSKTRFFEPRRGIQVMSENRFSKFSRAINLGHLM
jgi:hypothetical protein